MLVSTIRSRAVHCKFARDLNTLLNRKYYYLGMNVKTLLSVAAVREELALFLWMEVGACIISLPAVRIVTALDLLFISRFVSGCHLLMLGIILMPRLLLRGWLHPNVVLVSWEVDDSGTTVVSQLHISQSLKLTSLLILLLLWNTLNLLLCSLLLELSSFASSLYLRAWNLVEFFDSLRDVVLVLIIMSWGGRMLVLLLLTLLPDQSLKVKTVLGRNYGCLPFLQPADNISWTRRCTTILSMRRGRLREVDDSRGLLLISHIWNSPHWGALGEHWGIIPEDIMCSIIIEIIYDVENFTLALRLHFFLWISLPDEFKEMFNNWLELLLFVSKKLFQWVNNFLFVIILSNSDLHNVPNIWVS